MDELRTEPLQAATHINSGEWQSFEIRMRRRRVERLIARAKVALAEGNTDEVRDALAEARRLGPELPQFAALERALNAKESKDAKDSKVQVPQSAPLAVPSISSAPSIPSLPSTPSTHAFPWRSVSAAAAVIALAISGGAFWILRDVPQTEDVVVATSSAASPPAAARAPLPSARVQIETVHAAAIQTLIASEEEKAIDGPAFDPTATLTDVPRPATLSASAAATTGTVAASDLEVAPQPLPERLPHTAALDAPTPAPLAEPRADVRTEARNEARIAIPPAPDLRAPPPSPKVERAVDPPKVAEDAAVRGVLDRYAAAYSRLDASAAQQVWPAVNRSALSRAFDNLASQQVSLDNCAVDVRGESAQAKCAGSATWSPKVGNGGSRTEPRSWTFQLAKAGADWQIVSARVQNR